MRGQLIKKEVVRKILGDLRNDFPISDGLCQIAKNRRVHIKHSEGLIKMKMDDRIRFKNKLNDSEVEFVINEYFNELIYNHN